MKMLSKRYVKASETFWQDYPKDMLKRHKHLFKMKLRYTRIKKCLCLSDYV